MKIIEVGGNDEFVLKSVVYVADKDGKMKVCVNYSLFVGPKNSLEMIFEGFATEEVVRVKPKYKFSSLMRMFKDRRIYFNGVKYLDGQFEKKASE